MLWRNSLRILRFHRQFSDAVPLAFNVVGDIKTGKTPLVIGHGLFGQKQNWNSVAKALHRRLKAPVYTIDFRNHGDSPHTMIHTYESMVHDLSHFVSNVVVKETGCTRVNLLGHSMGGKVVSLFALTDGINSVINKLIVEDMAIHRSSPSHLFSGYVAALKGLDLSKPRRVILSDLENIVPELGIRQFLLTNLVVDGSKGYRWKNNLAGIGHSMKHVMSFCITQGIFHRPTCFIYGEKSQFFSDGDRDAIRSFFPNVVFYAVPNAGHWVHADNPENFVDRVVEFLSN